MDRYRRIGLPHWFEIPFRTVPLLDLEIQPVRRMQEILPHDFARSSVLVRGREEGAHCFEGATTQREGLDLRFHILGGGG